MKRLLGPRLPIEFAERADADITATSLLDPCRCSCGIDHDATTRRSGLLPAQGAPPHALAGGEPCRPSRTDVRRPPIPRWDRGPAGMAPRRRH